MAGAGSHDAVALFFEAVEKGDDEEVQRIVGARNFNGHQVLDRAARNGNEKAVDILISHPSMFDFLNKENDQLWTPLHEAVRNGHTALIKKLLAVTVPNKYLSVSRPEKPVNRQHRNNKQTVLHLAARQMDHKVAAAILDSPEFEKINAKDSNSQTALHVAAHQGNIKLAEALLNSDEFKEVACLDSNGQTALRVAAQHRNSADSLTEKNSHWVVCELILRRTVNTFGELHMALERQDAGIFGFLLKITEELEIQHGLLRFVPLEDKNTALCLAIQSSNEQVLAQLLDFSLKYDPGIIFQAAVKNQKKENTPIALARANKHLCNMLSEAWAIAQKKLARGSSEKRKQKSHEINKMQDLDVFCNPMKSRSLAHPDLLEKVLVAMTVRETPLGNGLPLIFLLNGPPGTGKTTLARQLAEQLHVADSSVLEADGRLVVINCANYKDEHAANALVGAMPGYEGGSGMLYDALSRRPDAVVILDEADKAHRKLMETLLPSLNKDGSIMSNQNDKSAVRTGNATFIFTSNLELAPDLHSAVRDHFGSPFASRVRGCCYDVVPSQDYIHRYIEEALVQTQALYKEQRNIDIHWTDEVPMLLCDMLGVSKRQLDLRALMDFPLMAALARIIHTKGPVSRDTTDGEITLAKMLCAEEDDASALTIQCFFSKSAADGVAANSKSAISSLPAKQVQAKYGVGQATNSLEQIEDVPHSDMDKMKSESAEHCVQIQASENQYAGEAHCQRAAGNLEKTAEVSNSEVYKAMTSSAKARVKALEKVDFRSIPTAVHAAIVSSNAEAKAAYNRLLSRTFASVTIPAVLMWALEFSLAVELGIVLPVAALVWIFFPSLQRCVECAWQYLRWFFNIIGEHYWVVYAFIFLMVALDCANSKREPGWHITATSLVKLGALLAVAYGVRYFWNSIVTQLIAMSDRVYAAMEDHVADAAEDCRVFLASLAQLSVPGAADALEDSSLGVQDTKDN